MNITMVSNPNINEVNQKEITKKQDNKVHADINKPLKDEISISDEAKRMQKKRISGTSEGVDILKADGKNGQFTIRFKNPAYIYRAIKEGSIVVNGTEIALDDETKDTLKKKADETFKAQEAATMLAAAEHNAMVAKQQGEAMSESMKEEQKLLEIAMRIMKGGKVPPQDEQKLATGNPEMYQMAKMAAEMNKNKEHKEYDSVDEDDKKGDSSQADSSESTDSPLKHIDRHYVDMDVSIGSEGSSVSNITTSVFEG